MNLNEFIV